MHRAKRMWTVTLAPSAGINQILWAFTLLGRLVCGDFSHSDTLVRKVEPRSPSVLLFIPKALYSSTYNHFVMDPFVQHQTRFIVAVFNLKIYLKRCYFETSPVSIRISTWKQTNSTFNSFRAKMNKLGSMSQREKILMYSIPTTLMCEKLNTHRHICLIKLEY